MHTVELEAGVEPIFPDRCLVCGHDQPDDRVELEAMGNANKPLSEEMLKVHRAQVPVCAACRPALRRARWLGKLLMLVSAAVSVALILGLRALSPGWLEGWVGYVVLALAIITPFLISRLIYTPYFDFQPWDRRLVFEFRDRGYAEAFAARNGAQVK